MSRRTAFRMEALSHSNGFERCTLCKRTLALMDEGRGSAFSVHVFSVHDVSRTTDHAILVIQLFLTLDAEQSETVGRKPL